MKYSLECRVEASMTIPPKVELSVDEGFTILFLPQTGGLLDGIQIVAPLPAGSRPPDFEIVENKLSIHTYTNLTLHEAMVKMFQSLESALAFCCPVARIRWHAPMETYIPENSEERAAIKINGFKFGHYSDSPQKVHEFPADDFFNAIKVLEHCPDLVVPLSFWREGNNALDSYRNIQAFFNFYFVLEGMYGRGEYRKGKLLPNFLKSTPLTDAVQRVLTQGFATPFRHDFATVESLLSANNLTKSVADVLELLIIYRGRLHHCLDTSQPAGTPLTDHEYEGISLLAATVSQNTLIAEIKARVDKALGVAT